MKTIRLFSLVAFAAFAFGAVADYVVYWQVNDAYDIYAQKDVNFDYATISGIKSSDPENPTTLRQVDENGEPISGTWIYSDPDDPNSFTTSAYSGTLTDLDEFDYYSIGLYGMSGELVGWQRYSNAQVQSHIFELGSHESGSGGDPLVVTRVVPEPTSALLVLLGMAGLALRRRRA